MFKKNKKQTETIKEPKEKKVRTVKVGTHKKTVIALWVVLIASVSFGVYKNFTAIDQHTTHEKEIIELRLQDTNGIENFVKNFAKSYYTWNNSKEAIESRTQAINGYLTKELQDLNVDTIRTDQLLNNLYLCIDYQYIWYFCNLCRYVLVCFVKKQKTKI